MTHGRNDAKHNPEYMYHDASDKKRQENISWESRQCFHAVDKEFLREESEGFHTGKRKFQQT